MHVQEYDIRETIDQDQKVIQLYEYALHQLPSRYLISDSII